MVYISLLKIKHSIISKKYSTRFEKIGIDEFKTTFQLYFFFCKKISQEFSFLLVRYAHQKGFVESRDPLSVALAGHLKGWPRSFHKPIFLSEKGTPFPPKQSKKNGQNLSKNCGIFRAT